MPPKRSQSGRTLTPNVRRRDLSAFAAAVLAPKKKQAKTRAPKRRTPPPPRSPSPTTEDEEEEAEDEAQAPPTQRNPPVDVSGCTFTIICTTKFNDVELVPDTKIVHLREFKVHDYNAMTTKTVHKEAERAKVGFEQKSAIATISGLRLKKCPKTIFDPSD
jgi:hypothetical protein